jgi:PTS system glucose-specific IIA component
MGLFSRLKKSNSEESTPIYAVADGETMSIEKVSDPVFSQKMLGESVAFHFSGSSVELCAPADGTLTVLFPTGHAYGITTKEGVEILVHCGINTVEAKGDGFVLLDKKQGDAVKAGEPVVKVDFDKLSKTYDMSTILIITNANGRTVNLSAEGPVTRKSVIGEIK